MIQACIRAIATAGLLLAGGAAAAGEGVYLISEFLFESGATLTDMKVGYETHGSLNRAKDNGILVTHDASAGKDAYDLFIGPGKAFDTDKYFVITIDAIGGGTSSAPADGLGPDFPEYTVRDMVRAQHDLLLRGFGLQSVRAIGGPAMGAFQALEWGILFPDYMQGLFMITPAAQSTRHLQAILDAVTAAIELDPRYRDGRYTEPPVDGMILGGMIYFPWLYTEEYISQIKEEAAWTAAIRAHGESWAARWDANSLLLRLSAMRNFDPSVPFAGNLDLALDRIEAETLIMPSMTDRTLPPDLARDLFASIDGADYVEIASRRGHLACCPEDESAAEYVFISQQIRNFLERLE